MAHGYPKGGKHRGGSSDKRAGRAAPSPSKTQTGRTHGTAKKEGGKKQG